ncbi:hypothetical protein O181_086176, partial [Austropuccinia psidii MF-1]|nr:hypothetical protein [Austropuccinia psidii MF-1]
MYKTMFLEDLFKSGFPMSIFAWNQCWESEWNQIFAKNALKHWNYLHQQGELKIFLINPKDNTHNNKSLILMRWFRGKQEDLKNDKLVPEALSKKASQKQKSRWRKK